MKEILEKIETILKFHRYKGNLGEEVFILIDKDLKDELMQYVLDTTGNKFDPNDVEYMGYKVKFVKIHTQFKIANIIK